MLYDALVRWSTAAKTGNILCKGSAVCFLLSPTYVSLCLHYNKLEHDLQKCFHIANLVEVHRGTAKHKSSKWQCLLFIFFGYRTVGLPITHIYSGNKKNVFPTGKSALPSFSWAPSSTSSVMSHVISTVIKEQVLRLSRSSSNNWLGLAQGLQFRTLSSWVMLLMTALLFRVNHRGRNNLVSQSKLTKRWIRQYGGVRQLSAFIPLPLAHLVDVSVCRTKRRLLVKRRTVGWTHW